MGATVPELEEIGIKADPHMTRQFRAEVADLLGRDGQTSFPGAQPVSFARNHILELQRRDYYVCEKSDGVRCLLYLTQDEAGQELTYLIDRKNDYYFVSGLHFPRLPEDPHAEIDYSSFHTETILDGELLYDMYDGGARRVLKFLVFDCLLVDRQNLMSRTLDKRLAYFHDKIHRPFQKLKATFADDCAEFKFEISKKDFQLGYAMDLMFKEILPKLAHGNDGLIFTCRETPYRHGTDEHILKWKPAEENSVDFKLRLRFPELPAAALDAPDPDGVWDRDYDALPAATLLVNGGSDAGGYRDYAAMHLPADDWARMKAWSVEHEWGLDGQIVECHQDAHKRWRFMRFRTDKADGNHYTVVEKVVQSIEDSVSREDLVRAAPRIRAAWKEREAAAKQRGQQDRARVEAERRRMVEVQHAPPLADDGYED